LPERDVLDFIDRRPADVELVLTGRYAPASFVARADLVTEMTAIKHYFDRGVKAREGIEK
jgi:cob(I)alamin adenosyltransferase